MHREEVTIEGLHVNIRPAWRAQVEREIAHLESQHPRAFTRIAVRFTPVKPHHPGLRISIGGRVDEIPFNIERQGHDIPGTVHEAFAIALRLLQDGGQRSQHVNVEFEPSEMAAEEAIVEAEARQPAKGEE